MQRLLHFQIADLQKQQTIYLSSFSLQVTLKHTVSIHNLTDIAYTLTLLSYVASGFSSQAITSGAIQYGVPMNVLRLPTVRSSWALTPKSTGIYNSQLYQNTNNNISILF